MNSRLKSFGFGKRKSTASIQNPDGATPSNTPPPGQIPQQRHSGPTPPLAASSSSTSLPMNHPGAAGNRPPSYTANYPPGPPGPPGQQQPLGRTSPMNQGPGPNRTPPSQMAGGPPPINTAGPPAGYPPNMNPMGGGQPPMGGPPPGPPGAPQQGAAGFGAPVGYPPGAPPPPGGPIAQQFQRNSAAEVEGSSKSKSQLIVGIDFVSSIRLVLRGTNHANRQSDRVPPSPVWPLPLRQTMRPRKILLPNGPVLDHIQNKRFARISCLDLRLYRPYFSSGADIHAPDSYCLVLRPISKSGGLGP